MININKKTGFFTKHRVFFFIFFLLPIYHFVIVNNFSTFRVNPTTYAFYTVDYSMGFCDKILPGELFHLLVGKYTEKAVTSFVFVFYILLIILLSFMIERFVLSFKDKTKTCFTLICVFLCGPFSVGMFVKEFGMLDFFWAFFFFLAVVCLNHKYLKFFVPILSVMMILIHYGSIICYVAALLMIILFYAFNTEKKNERNSFLIIFAFSFLVTTCLTIYFMKNNGNNLVYSFEEFNRIVAEERGSIPIYYDTNFYKQMPPEMASNEWYRIVYEKGLMGEDIFALNNVFKIIIYQVKTTFNSINYKEMIVCFGTAFLPQILLIYLLINYLKNNTTKIKKLITVLFILLSGFIELIGGIFSTDTPRWVGHSVMLLFVFVFIILRSDYQEGVNRADNLFSKMRYSIVLTLVFIYANMVLDPYTFNFY